MHGIDLGHFYKKNVFANIKKDFYKYMDRSGTLLQKKFLCNYKQFSSQL